MLVENVNGKLPLRSFHKLEYRAVSMDSDPNLSLYN